MVEQCYNRGCSLKLIKAPTVRSFAVPLLIFFVASETSAQATRNEFQATTHWAFEPVRPVAVPDDPSGWSAGTIDRFIRLKPAEQGLKPVETADRRCCGVFTSISSACRRSPRK